MKRLIATLVVGGVLVFGIAPVGASPGTLPEAACHGQQVKDEVTRLGGQQLTELIEEFGVETVGDVHEQVKLVCASQ